MAALVLVLLPSLACQSSRPAARLEMTNLDDGRRFEQTFRAARFARGGGGVIDIVLVDQTEGLSPTEGGRGLALSPTSSSPLTHLMHVRVLWKPVRTIRPKAPSASNATVQWTVLSRDGGRIDYNGAGFAQITTRGDDELRVRLRNIRLTPTARGGDLDDPIGPVVLDTSFKAYSEPQTVATALSMIRRDGALGSTASPGDFDGPPARVPGP